MEKIVKSTDSMSTSGFMREREQRLPVWGLGKKESRVI